MKRLVEIRSYKMKPGARDAFHAAASQQAVPLLRRWAMDVVAFGPSPHDPDAYYLVRAYDDLADLESRQQAFYGSDDWTKGPRGAIVPLVESFLNTVLWLSPDSIDDLRRSNATAAEPLPARPAG
jgi:hypothetical protein